MADYARDSESYHRINRQPAQADIIPVKPTREELQYELDLTRGAARKRPVLRLRLG